jgi:hypothetical protein
MLSDASGHPHMVGGMHFLQQYDIQSKIMQIRELVQTY